MKHLSLQGFLRALLLGCLAGCCGLMDGMLAKAWGQALRTLTPQPSTAVLPQPPDLVVLPWQYIAVMPEQRRSAQRELTEARQVWLAARAASGEINDQQNLAAYLTGKTTQNARQPINLRPFLTTAVAGVWPAAKSMGLPLAITPAVCSLADSYLVMIAVHHRDQRYLVAGGHHLIGKTIWQQDLKAKRLKATLSAALTSAWQRTTASFIAAPQRPAAALQIGLSMRQESSRQDHGSNLCLQQLVAEKLAAKSWRMMPVLGHEDLASLDHLWPRPGKRSRATRQLIFTWQYPHAAHPEARQTFPLQLSLSTSHAEAVFGGHIEPATQSQWAFAPAGDGSLSYDIAGELISFLEQEEKALLLETPARIAGINRAWVYLDKGRAYGLKVNDRMVVSGAENDIQGHVVGYFGPELRLVTPDGQAVHEGAIVYIRKGQRLTKLGQQLVFDPETFPTPWPPR